MNRFQVNPMKQIALIALLSLAATAAMAKLPVLSEEAKTKAVEAAAKAAHGGKVDAYKLCQSMDRVGNDAGRRNGARATLIKPPQNGKS